MPAVLQHGAQQLNYLCVQEQGGTGAIVLTARDNLSDVPDAFRILALKEDVAVELWEGGILKKGPHGRFRKGIFTDIGEEPFVSNQDIDQSAVIGAGTVYVVVDIGMYEQEISCGHQQGLFLDEICEVAIENKVDFKEIMCMHITERLLGMETDIGIVLLSGAERIHME